MYEKELILLATKTITVRVDEETKQKAEVLLEEIGLNMTVLFNACLKAVVGKKGAICFS